MTPLVVLNVVGLTPRLAAHAPRLSALGGIAPWRSPLPAVTCTSQATMLTGTAPREHGIVGNGWYYRDTAEVRFWQQSHALIQRRCFYEDFDTAKMFWWFNGSAPVQASCTPKPHYGSDGSKAFDVYDRTGCDLTDRLGPFPFFSFWGPHAGLPSSRWIAEASALVIRQRQPQLTLVYLPHLDYDHQRSSDPPISLVTEVDQCAAIVIDAATSIGAQVVAVSEYGLMPVDRPIHINQALRREGLLETRGGPFGSQLVPGDCRAFAVADHQLAHVYVKNPGDRESVRRIISDLPGVAAVVPAGDLELDHERAGDWIALAEPNSWFTYYFWGEGETPPDYAPTVDIHRKPGYDPVELFATSKLRAVARVAQKKLGFRYRMDVIPLDATLVGGSHGIHPADPMDGPVIIGPGQLPETMTEFPRYAVGRLNA
ncbi:MAG: nucleotide pyrophosphatase/phosphodiesterase family protein [Planctomycetota bacterium]